VLGFFHRWLQEFALHCTEVTVIAQSVGSYELPANVLVVSLGKERGNPLFLQVIRFWWLSVLMARRYRRVLVHMTPVWVVLGWPVWLLLRASVFLWYEVRRGGVILQLAVYLARRTFTATPAGLPFPSKRAIVTGHGIDTELFAQSIDQRDPDLVVAVGRVTGIKHYDQILACFRELPSHMRLRIVGGVVTGSDVTVLASLESLIRQWHLTGRVMISTLSHGNVAMLLRQASLMLHASQGGLDKVVLEAMAAGCPIVSTGLASAHVLPERCIATHKDFSGKAKAILDLSSEEKSALQRELRRTIEEKHSLHALVPRLVSLMA
jgi:glycosyltransferase involved in cell wall biosynthesis